MKYLLCAVLAYCIGFHIGWAYAHVTVAAECGRLGGFFVGERVFICALKDTKEAQGKNNG